MHARSFWKMFFDWNKHGYIVFFAGSLSWFFGVALWVTSIAWVRRNYFKARGARVGPHPQTLTSLLCAIQRPKTSGGPCDRACVRARRSFT